MPIVLMQRAWQDDPQYKDTEFSVYHYPRKYFDEIRGGERFVYYRPSRGSASGQGSSYFGCGELGEIYPDRDDADHRFVDIERPVPFAFPVPYEDPLGRMYESGFHNRSAFQGRSIRHVDDLDFYRILAAAGLTGAMFGEMPTVSDVIAGRASPLLMPPRDPFRPLHAVPPGTGYRPNGSVPDVQESAALQERARADHQDTLSLFKRLVDRSGGSCLFNNNVDLLATFGEQKLLVEVKSLTRPLSSVDRMRYGMGQLFDYSVRYRAEVGRTKPVLAFGSMIRSDVAWISDILQGNDVAFVARDGKDLKPINELARALPIFM
ncbi:MAG: EVE domain-containing protein [Candidatus Eremiobacteraeota bacterium]|nr:EVE domain-containing protein [Candidatus Eremiobacteraeota bacterium]